jgi:hypothetical protein
MKGLYEQCILPKPFTVLGRNLKPFNFGHFIVLKRFNVGCVSDEVQKLTLEDLIFSIFICSHTFNECKELLYSGKWNDEVKAWGDSLANSPVDMEEAAREFNEYLAYHTVRPKTKPAPGAGNKTVEKNAEWYEGIIRKLMQKGYSSEQVMELCFSQGLYEYTAIKEDEGCIIILSEKNEQGLEYLKQQRQQKV